MEWMTSSWFIPTLSTLLIAVGGVWWVQRSSGAKEVTEATLLLIEPLNQRITLLDAQMKTQETSLAECKTLFEASQKTLADLESQLTATQKQLDLEKGERAKDRRRLSRFERWAKALAEQVIELGGIPIALDEIE